MRVWLDALTPKQLLFMSSIAKKLEKKGFKTIITIRKENNVIEMARRLGLKTHVVGEYGYTRSEKLVKDAERTLLLAKKIMDNPPDMLVSYPSPSAVRTAFGLSIPITIYSDTPHATHVHRITIPLANHFIFSRFIDKSEMTRYILPAYTKLYRYNGVEELAWIKDFKPNKQQLEELGLEPFSYIVMRPSEKHASYYKWDRDEIFKELIKYVSRRTKVILLPRYERDKKLFKEKNVIIPKESPLATNIIYYSMAAITGGGTIAREASLLGVPGITLYPGKLIINNKLAQKGFPLYKPSSLQETINLIQDILKNPEKHRINTQKKIDGMEDPVKPLLDILC